MSAVLTFILTYGPGLVFVVAFNWAMGRSWARCRCGQPARGWWLRDPHSKMVFQVAGLAAAIYVAVAVSLTAEDTLGRVVAVYGGLMAVYIGRVIWEHEKNRLKRLRDAATGRVHINRHGRLHVAAE